MYATHRGYSSARLASGSTQGRSCRRWVDEHSIRCCLRFKFISLFRWQCVNQSAIGRCDFARIWCVCRFTSESAFLDLRQLALFYAGLHEQHHVGRQPRNELLRNSGRWSWSGRLPSYHLRLFEDGGTYSLSARDPIGMVDPASIRT